MWQWQESLLEPQRTQTLSHKAFDRKPPPAWYISRADLARGRILKASCTNQNIIVNLEFQHRFRSSKSNLNKQTGSFTRAK
jgi:hypothetical protein